MNRKNPTKTQLKKLFHLTSEIKAAKPWETVRSELVFGVKLSGSTETGYIQTIGQLGEVFGILIYREETALHRVKRLTSHDSMLELDMFSLMFEDLSGLPLNAMLDFDTDEYISEDCPEIPIVMSHSPGYVPDQITGDEAVIVIEYLEQALEVFRRKTTEQFYDIDSNNMKCLYRTYLSGQWVDSINNIPASSEQNDKYKLASKLLKNLWKLPTSTKSMQASLFLFPGSIGQPSERPSTAYLLLIVDEDTGFASHELLLPAPSLRKMELSVPDILLKKLIEIGCKPRHLSIPEGDKLFRIIEEMGVKKIPFPVKEVEEELLPLEDVCEDLCDSVLTGKAPSQKHSFKKQSAEQEKCDGKILQVKVALIGNKRIYRKIAISENQTLHSLHAAIFHAFDREEEHLYSFFFPNQATSSKRVMMDSPEFSLPIEDSMFSFKEQGDSTEATLGSLRLKEKQKFYYLFDWGDEWWHELTFEGECSTEEKQLPAIILKKGDSPSQYPDWDE